MSLRGRIAALLGVSAYEAAPASAGPSITDAFVEKLRSMFGGQITPPISSQTRFYLEDLETAIHAADGGDLAPAARLWRAMRRDGVLAGILATTTRGVAALPKKFVGDEEMVHILEGRDGARSVFDAMCPPAELMAMVADGEGMGVSLGELVPVPTRDYPVLCRRDPEFLRYRWSDNQWFFQSIAGLIPITPGDGRWVLHFHGSREAPWQAGMWPALGSSYIRKTHAQLYKANWEATLAHPARAAISPGGATEDNRVGFLDRLIAWGPNQSFELPPGWDVKIIEANGRGHESFDETIERCDREYAIALAGQVMTTDGGQGFSNGDVGENRLEARIAAMLEALAFTINTQVIPQWAAARYPDDDSVIDRAPVLSWDTTPPQDEKKSSEAIGAFGLALKQANAALASYGKRVDALELASQYGLPLVDLEPKDETDGSDEIDEDLDENVDEDEDAEVIDLEAVRAAYGRTGT